MEEMDKLTNEVSDYLHKRLQQYPFELGFTGTLSELSAYYTGYKDGCFSIYSFIDKALQEFRDGKKTENNTNKE